MAFKDETCCMFDNKIFKVICDRQLQYYLLQKCKNGISKLKFVTHFLVT